MDDPRAKGSQEEIYLGTISAKLLMHLDALPATREAERAAPRCHPRAKMSTSVYARMPGCVDDPRAKGSQDRTYLGTISAKLLMHLDERPATREAERAAPRCHPHAKMSTSIHTPGRIITYIRQVELLHRQGVWTTHGPNAPKSLKVPRHHFSQAADVPS